nr:hypothetical protein [Cnuella takakiae]
MQREFGDFVSGRIAMQVYCFFDGVDSLSGCQYLFVISPVFGSYIRWKYFKHRFAQTLLRSAHLF